LGSEAFRWSVVPAILAWLVLVRTSTSTLAMDFCLSPTRDRIHDFFRGIEATLASLNPGVVALKWGLMLVAMMAPLLTPMISQVAAKSFVDRRELSVGLFVAAYAGVWVAVACVAFFAILVVQTTLSVSGLALFGGMLGVSAAALWQMSEAKRRALNRCHGVRPLRASGAAANIDALRFGALHGSRCARSCAPTMFLAMMGAHSLAFMAVISVVLLAERTTPRPRQAPGAALLILAAIATAAAPLAH
jgi:predicted metal-binding membrane protein